MIPYLAHHVEMLLGLFIIMIIRHAWLPVLKVIMARLVKIPVISVLISVKHVMGLIRINVLNAKRMAQIFLSIKNGEQINVWKLVLLVLMPMLIRILVKYVIHSA